MENSKGKFIHFDHIRFHVGNAKQAAFWYCVSFGFKPLAYRGLETGSAIVAEHAVQHGKIIFVFKSSIVPSNREEMHDQVDYLNNAVVDIAFEVESIEAIVESARSMNLKILKDITEEYDDYGGSIKLATIGTNGNIIHTLIDRKSYKGCFLPGFRAVTGATLIYDSLSKPQLERIHRCTVKQCSAGSKGALQWYESALDFHRVWSTISDSSVIGAQNSALRSVILANSGQPIELTKKEISDELFSILQMQEKEFIDYFGRTGIHYIALRTSNIIQSVIALNSRGVEFLQISDKYYEGIKGGLQSTKIKVIGDIEMYQNLNIVISYDEKGGYLLRAFTKPSDDQSILLIAIVEQNNYQDLETMIDNHSVL